MKIKNERNTLVPQNERFSGHQLFSSFRSVKRPLDETIWEMM